MKKILAIFGPTSTGKTDVGLSLAKKFNGELVSCDSRQVYKDLDIGTGKMPGKIFNLQFSIYKGNGFWIIDGVKVWMYDVADPKERYDVSRYIKDAGRSIEKIISVKKIPIIVGGTGLYFKGLTEGFNLGDKNESLRKELENLSLEEVREKLILLSPAVWESLNESERKNKRRLVRKIEKIRSFAKIAQAYGSEEDLMPQARRDDTNRFPIREALGDDMEILKIGLYAPRPVLNYRIDARVDSRIKDGMIEEAQRLHKNGLAFKRMKELGLEYGMLAKLLSGEIRGIGEFKEILKVKIHQFAKRQMTWFRNQEKDILWFDITETGFMEKVERSVEDWYNSSIT